MKTKSGLLTATLLISLGSAWSSPILVSNAGFTVAADYSTW